MPPLCWNTVRPSSPHSADYLWNSGELNMRKTLTWWFLSPYPLQTWPLFELALVWNIYLVFFFSYLLEEVLGIYYYSCCYLLFKMVTHKESQWAPIYLPVSFNIYSGDIYSCPHLKTILKQILDIMSC